MPHLFFMPVMFCRYLKASINTSISVKFRFNTPKKSKMNKPTKSSTPQHQAPTYKKVTSMPSSSRSEKAMAGLCLIDIPYSADGRVHEASTPTISLSVGVISLATGDVMREQAVTPSKSADHEMVNVPLDDEQDQLATQAQSNYLKVGYDLMRILVLPCFSL